MINLYFSVDKTKLDMSKRKCFEILDKFVENTENKEEYKRKYKKSERACVYVWETLNWLKNYIE